MGLFARLHRAHEAHIADLDAAWDFEAGLADLAERSDAEEATADRTADERRSSTIITEKEHGMYTITDQRAEHVEAVQFSVESAYEQWPPGHALHVAVPGYLARTVGEDLMSAHADFTPEQIRSIIADGFIAASHDDPALVALVSGIVLSDPTFIRS